MVLIQWNDSLSVDIAEIDKQHQKLVGMINDLHTAMGQGKGRDALGRIINELLVYTGTHFRTEEKYFDQFGYPDTANHKQEHADFAQKVTEFRDGFGKGQVGLSMQVMTFLSGWLTNHIKGSDRKYRPFLTQNGLK